MDSIFYRLSLSNMYIFWKRKYISKVQLFWEDHKNVRNRHYGFEIYLNLSSTGQGTFHLEFLLNHILSAEFFQNFPNSFGGENWDKLGYFDTLSNSLSLKKVAPWLL